MSDAFSQSDDDLFAYEPSREVKNTNSIYDSYSSNSKQNNELYDQISRNIQDNDEENFLEINALRVKFSQAVLGSYDFWISPTTPSSYASTVAQVLNQLTDGRFSDLYLFNNLEANIIRRSQLIYLLDGTFKGENSESDSFKSFTKKIGVDVDQSYVPTYVGTLVRISTHILAKERSMYLELAQKLDIVPNPTALENQDSGSVLDQMGSDVHSSVQTKQQNHLSNTFISNFSESFVSKLNNMNNSNIAYEIRSI